jgi:hypothetical protein
MVEHPEIVDRQPVGDARAFRQQLARRVRAGIAQMNSDLHGGILSGVPGARKSEVPGKATDKNKFRCASNIVNSG